LKPVAESLAARIDAIGGLSASALPDKSQPGSGSAPDVYLDTFVVRVQSDAHSPDALARRLRMGEPGVFARIQEGALLLDPRTLFEGDADALVKAFEAVAQASAG